MAKREQVRFRGTDYTVEGSLAWPTVGPEHLKQWGPDAARKNGELVDGQQPISEHALKEYGSAFQLAYRYLQSPVVDREAYKHRVTENKGWRFVSRDHTEAKKILRQEAAQKGHTLHIQGNRGECSRCGGSLTVSKRVDGTYMNMAIEACPVT